MRLENAGRKPSEGGKISAVQVLRAIAASIVVVFHSFEFVARGLAASQFILISAFNYVMLGNAGVDLFFCLSGFVMVYIHGNDFGNEGASSLFLRKRFMRIAPIYWLLTTVVVALMFVAPQLFNARGLDWTWITMSYLFVPWMSASGVESPVLGLGWTLNFEMYFYAWFAVLLLLPKRLFLPLLTAFFAASVGLGLLVSAQHPLTQMLTSPMLLEFLAGCYIGFARQKGVLLPKAFGASFVVAALLVFATSTHFVTAPVFPPPLRVIFWGIPAALLLAAVTLTRWKMPAPRSLVFVGDASYSIYLTHGFTVPAVGRLGSALQLSPDVMFALMIFTSILAGCGFYLLVEKRILQLQRSRHMGERGYSAAGSA
jgi:exopolysaccharide production protein ExoZ